ncbi:MAG: hypothetical protein P4L76_13195 [Beijerinckiaceae bacterium]|nr:hypothetical protein [Beijerinckiaceae bacterium]
MTANDGPSPRGGRILYKIWRSYLRIVRGLTSLVFGVGLIFLSVFFINYVVLSTPKVHAYRNLDPSVRVCADGLATGWTVLAETGREKLRAAEQDDDDGWADPSNDEAAVAAKNGPWPTALRCALQRHVIPSTVPAGKPVDYNLGFLEFQEDGEPYALVSNDAHGDKPVTSAMLRHAMEFQMHATHKPASAVRPIITQLDVLKQHLATGSHYVIVFIHGWRHDARIGDQNVADLRLYAAHAARFLAERCPSDPAYCDMKVTAIYVGWRGARVDEPGLSNLFGSTIGGFLGNLSAGATLFDRKPVSEQVAPAAISALRTLESVLTAREPGAPERHNKMIVFGHSLGGNMLATGLQDDLIKSVRRHKFGETLPPVLGDLVVLINPAAEAAKWTATQREVWSRIAFHTDENTSMADVTRETGFFPATQKPVIVSVTAALAFPAGGLREGDCEWIGLDIDDKYAAARTKIRERLAKSDSMFDNGIDYDWATHDLFPTFKLDFRPAADYLERIAARIEGHQPPGQTCAKPGRPSWFAEMKALPLHTLALLAATFPFQNSAREQSHTIGHVDPPRPAEGLLADDLPSAAPFGTTHELLGLHEAGFEKHHPYATLADAPLTCPASNHWLARARANRADRLGAYWDSESLGPATPGATGEGRPAAEFVHGFALSGTAAITRGNDPFWNMRAFDNALSRHDGYRLTSFICAMNQLVMDDITGMPSGMVDHMRDPMSSGNPNGVTPPPGP